MSQKKVDDVKLKQKKKLNIFEFFHYFSIYQSNFKLFQLKER